MADVAINDLPVATNVQSADLMVLWQQATGTARSISGQSFTNWLVAYADGHGGIQSIAKTMTAGLVDTYTITYADESTDTFTVTNGAKGETGDQTYVWIKWASQEPTADNQMSNIPDAWIGIYAGTTSPAPSTYTSYTWYRYKGDTGATGAPIDDVQRTSGTGAPGTTDTYTMYVDGDAVGTFEVYNGSDGTGSPGSQTPLIDSGAGSVGVAVAYSREDHQHPMPSASDVGAMKYYKSVTELGLTSGSATIAAAYAALSNGSFLMCNANEFAPAEVPSIYATVEISKPAGDRGFINYRGKSAESASGASVMYLDGSTGVPDGVWETLASMRQTTVTIETTWTDSGSGYYTQTVTISGRITNQSKVDLQPSATAIAQLISDGVFALYIDNTSGTLTAYAVGGATTASLTLQCTVTEVG